MLSGWIKGAVRVLAAAACMLSGTKAAPAPFPVAFAQRQGAHSAQQAPTGERQQVWWGYMHKAILDIQAHGCGGYSQGDDAHDALGAAFVRDARSGNLVFHAEGARPSFCSGAVYAALLSALIQWDAGHGRRMTAEAWQALIPHRVPDGVGVWGQINANGPGLAVLVHRLGAGFSFTDAVQARPGDIMKIWWTPRIGGGERGHLVVLVEDKGEEVLVWASHHAQKGKDGGYGYRTFPKGKMARVLYTRITNPEAFLKAPSVGTDAWLGSLLQQQVTWEECLRRAGVGED